MFCVQYLLVLHIYIDSVLNCLVVLLPHLKTIKPCTYHTWYLTPSLAHHIGDFKTSPTSQQIQSGDNQR